MTETSHLNKSALTGFLAACDNPVSIERVTTIPFMFAEFDWDHHFDSLAQLMFRASIVGRKGSGKTTLMNALALQMSQRGIEFHHVFLPHETDNHHEMIDGALRSDKIILVDGIERISILQRFRLYRQTKQKAGLIINVHRPCPLPTWIGCETSPELMSNLLTRLGLDQPSIQLAGQKTFSKHKGNIRMAFRELYDQFSSSEFNVILSR